MSYQQFSLVMQREKKTSMAHLMHAFRKMDLKNDGFITFQELQRNLTKVNSVILVAQPLMSFLLFFLSFFSFLL